MSLPSEEWKDIPGWEGRYQVSDHGNVRSLRTLVSGEVTERLLTPRPLPKGHLRVSLCKEGVCRDFPIHALVLEAFVGPRPEGAVTCHWDDDPTNNQLNNLRWGTASENLFDRVRNGRHTWAEADACIRGHKFAGPNLYRTGGQRVCRACRYGRRKAASEGGPVEVYADYYYKELYVTTSSELEPS